jgi:hypothetical protein
MGFDLSPFKATLGTLSLLPVEAATAWWLGLVNWIFGDYLNGTFAHNIIMTVHLPVHYWQDMNDKEDSQAKAVQFIICLVSWPQHFLKYLSLVLLSLETTTS